MSLTCPHCSTPNRPGASFCAKCGRPLAVAYAARGGYVSLRPGQVIKSQYTIVNQLGQGGMGAIYLAKQPLAGKEREVVVKEMLDYFDPSEPMAAQKAAQRFRDEAGTLVTLNHPGIPQIYDFFSENGRNYIVMQFVAGQNLEYALTHPDDKGQIVQGHPYGTNDVVRWGIQACRILEYLSQQRPPLVHHDIKPANLIVDQHTGDIRLVDFGTAKTRLAAQTAGPTGVQKSSIFGTLGYAPPEQPKGQSEPRSDVFALAATPYHCLTDDDPGDHPLSFPGLDTRKTVLAEALKRALTLDVARRPTADQFRADLEAAEAAVKGSARPRVTPGRPLPPAPPPEYSVILPDVPASLRKRAEQALMAEGLSPADAVARIYQTPVAIQARVSLAKAQLVQSQWQSLGMNVQLVQPNPAPAMGLPPALRQTLEKDGQIVVTVNRLPPDRRCHCALCGYDWVSIKAAGARPPLKCPSCKRGDWNRMLLTQCRVCGHVHQGGRVPPVCPVCGASYAAQRSRQLSLSPTQVDFGNVLAGQTRTATVRVSTSQVHTLLRGEARSLQPWITISPSNINGLTDVTLSVMTTGLSADTQHTATVEFITSGGVGQVTVSLKLIRPPQVQVDTTMLDFGLVARDEKPTRVVRVVNTGGGDLNGQVVATPAEWLSVDVADFRANAQAIRITVDGSGLSLPAKPGRVSIDTNGGRVEVVVHATPLGTTLSVQPAALNFPDLPVGRRWRLSLHLANRGTGVLQGQLRADQPWLKLEPDTFLGAQITTVWVDTKALEPGQAYSGQVFVDSNGGKAVVPVNVTIAPESELQRFLRRMLGH